MTSATVVAIVLVVGVAVIFLIQVVHLLVKRALNAALSSLMTLLGTLIVALVAPSVEGQADISVSLGSYLLLKGNYLKVNSPQPTALWITAFASVALLSAYTLWLIRESESRAASIAPRSSP